MSGGGRWRAALVVVLAAGLLVPVSVVAVPAGAQGVPLSVHPYFDQDDDDDGLIEVSSLRQLNAIRWDMNGDGAVDYYLGHDDGQFPYTPWTSYRAAFPHVAALGMGCPSFGCIGYELVADLDFDTNGNGQADSGDAYWNGGKGWVPLWGGKAIDSSEKYLRFIEADEHQRRLGDRPDRRVRMFTGVFEGNGRTIANLYINNPDQFHVGLFSYIGPGAQVRNVGLSAPNSGSRVHGYDVVGALAGDLEGGRVSGVWSDVDVSAAYSSAGGLVGANWRGGVIVESYATGDVSGPAIVGGLVGMLNQAGAASVYATGNVTASREDAGGLVGNRIGGYMRAAYATGDVTVTDGRIHRYRDGNGIVQSQNIADAGGLAGAYGNGNSLETRANYSTGAVAVPDGHAGSGGLIGACRPHSGDEPKASYWDTEASGVSSGECATGHTTAQLQAPTGYTGIYSTWNLDIDDDGTGDDPWDFGTASQYPVLKYCADKPGIDTADGQPYCPLRVADQRIAMTALSVPDTEEPPAEQDGAQPDGYTVDPSVVAKVQALAGQTQHGSAHVNRWNRVLVAFGAHDGTGVSGGAMTAAEAQQMADAHSSSVWDEVVAELTALEAAPQQTPPPPPPPTPVVTVTGGSGVTEGGTVSFTVSASPAPAADLAVAVTVATSGDFGFGTLPASVTIPVSGTATVTVATADDAADEPDGAVTLTVDAGSGYVVGAPSAETVTVADDDDPAQELTDQGYTVDAAVVAKVQDLAGQTQHGSAHVNRWRRALAGLGALDAAAVSGGAMTAAEAQQMADTHSSPVWDEVAAELTALEAAAQQTPPPPPPPTPAVSVTSAAGGTEGDPATFTLTASPAPAADLTVDVTVAATGDFGYGTLPTSVTIPASGTATVTVTTADDAADEADGQVTLTLNAGSGYTVGTPSAQTVTVADDDPPVVVEPDPPVVVEPDPPVVVEPDPPDQSGQQDGTDEDVVLAGCGDSEPTLSISGPQASRGDATVDFEASLSCVPAGRPMILVTPVRDGDITHNMFVAFSAERTSATVTVDIGTETQLGLALVWSSGLANRQAQGNVDWTD